jgi:hypothetical protein
LWLYLASQHEPCHGQRDDQHDIEYLYIDQIDEAAAKRAAEQGISIGEMVDLLNEDLRKEEERKRPPIGVFSITAEGEDLRWLFDQGRSFTDGLEAQLSRIVGARS